MEKISEKKQRIAKEASSELKINSANLIEENIATFLHFQKYWRYLEEAKHDLLDAEFKFNKISLERFNYYFGKAPAEVYKEHPFHAKLLKSDVHKYVEADDAVKNASKELQTAKSLVDYLETLIKNHINNRGFVIRDIIEWKKFTHGQE